MTDLIIFLLVTAAIVSWWQLMLGRQKARRAADIVCGNHDLQLLDDTVSLSSVSWSREGGGTRILVNYGFEFATNGARRNKGVATLSFPGNLTVSLETTEGQLIEEFR